LAGLGVISPRTFTPAYSPPRGRSWQEFACSSVAYSRRALWHGRFRAT
jgi:hypothetical protein